MPSTQNIKQTLHDTVGAIDAVLDVYSRENDILERADTNHFLAIQEEKLLAAQVYQVAIEQILERKDELHDAPPGMKEKISEKQQKFSAVAKRNLDMLGRMKKGMNRFGEILRKSAQDVAVQHNAISYGASGVMADTQKRAVSTGINETA